MNKTIMAKYCATFVFIVCSLLFVKISVTDAQIPSGRSSFTMAEPTGRTNAPLNVYCYRGENWTPNSTIVVVFHGMNRNAGAYRESWVDFAEQYGFLVVCPELDKSKYPSSYYQKGNVSTKTNGKTRINNEDKWVYPVVNHVINEAKERSGASENAKVVLFGHSAGAQFLHRYVLLGGSMNADRVYIANSGYYTMPDVHVDYSYGMKGIPNANSRIKAAFLKPVTILLGTDDTRRTSSLNQSPLADAQGRNRFERGIRFYENCKTLAEKNGFRFNWRLIKIQGVGHDNKQMAAGIVQEIGELSRGKN